MRRDTRSISSSPRFLLSRIFPLGFRPGLPLCFPLCLLVCAACLPAGLHAQPATAKGEAYPARPVRLIVPFAAGGGNDTVARVVTQQLSTTLGQQVFVDNRPGAGGVVGAEAAARAPADGYTLFLGGVGSHAVNPNLHAKLPYDAVRDFAPIILLASAPAVLVVHNSVPADTLPAFVALAKSKPGQLAYASNGNGSSAQLAAAMFETAAGIKMVHVPYKGLAPALSDLLAGQVQLMFSSLVAIMPQVQAGKLRALAVTGKKRSALLPALPTIAESGYPGYESGSWYGLLAPAGTPREIVAKLNAEAANALRNPAVREQFAREGSDIIGGTPEDFAAHIRGEIARMAQAVKAARINLE